MIKLSLFFFIVDLLSIILIYIFYVTNTITRFIHLVSDTTKKMLISLCFIYIGSDRVVKLIYLERLVTVLSLSQLKPVGQIQPAQ